ncbi:MAG: hypothetical protein ACXVA9_09310, partial [Bdellovibrionales bacterium]
ARIEPLQKTLNCKFAGEPRTELRWLGGWHLVFKRTCEAPDGSAYEVVVNSHGRLISHLPAGANMTSVTESVTLYPKGPKFSALKQIQLPVSADPNFLSVNVLEVTSDANAKFSNLGQLSQVVPSDDRFDMLQAYYYSTQSLEWIAEHLKFQYSGLKLRTQVGYPQKSNVAFYYGREIRIGQGDDITFSHMAWDPSIVIHETMHAVIEALTRLPLGQGEGGSLQEGLADILTALQLDNPQMGEASYKLAPYQRTLANDSKLADKNGSLYHDSLILSGTLWEIKSEINAAAAEDATAFLLAHLTPSSGFDDVKNQLRDWLKTLNDKEKFTAAETVLRMRGWL